MGLDAADVRVQSWGLSGDDVSVSGLLAARSVDAARVLRQQLNGYVNNPDEPVVPVTWSADPTVDGFYRVVAASVAIPANASVSSAMFSFSLSLQRVRGFSAPIIETSIVGAVRENAHSISSEALAAIGVPGSSTEFFDTGVTSDVGTADVFFRDTADGDVRLAIGDVYQRRQSWTVPADSYYEGAATITSCGAAVVGRQVPADESEWTLQNGILRIAPNGVLLRVMDLTAGDGTAQDLRMDYNIADSTATAASMRILRNSPEECSIRLAYEFDRSAIPTPGVVAKAMRVSVDLTLRRGERVVRGLISSSARTNMGVVFTANRSATDVTGGRMAASTDANGYRWVLSTPQAFVNVANGGIRNLGLSSRFSWAFGFEPASAGTYDTAQALIYQYMAATSETARVAAR